MTVEFKNKHTLSDELVVFFVTQKTFANREVAECPLVGKLSNINMVKMCLFSLLLAFKLSVIGCYKC